MSGILQASTIRDSASATNNLALDSSGNVTVGNNLTVSGTGVLNIGSGQIYKDSSGNVGIGTSSPGGRLEVASANNIIFSTGTAGYGSFYARGSGTNAAYIFMGNTTSGELGRITTDSTGVVAFSNTTSSLERMRIDSSGTLLVGTTDSGGTTGVGLKFVPGSTAPYVNNIINTAGTTNHYYLYNTNATNNGYRFYVGSNGGISNYSANNTNLSDQRLKKDIQLAGPYLDKICAIPVKTFLYKDQSDNELNLGVIAQDVEAVAPELVNKDGWETKAPEGEEPYKSIYQTDLQYALMKALQEANAKIDAQAADIAALKTKVGV